MKKQSNYQRYGNYIINRGQSLGSGTYGKVYRGYRIMSENSFGNYERLRLQPVAIKESYCQASNYQEINILKILNHPNIIRYIDYKIHGNSLFMIMELCEQGTLEDLLMELPEDDNLNDLLTLYFAQIVAGIKFMYQKNILHRDIKPSNLLIKDNTVKIADFGTSKLQDQKQLRTLVGTPLFSSPELLQISIPTQEQLNTPLKSTYTEKSDIWSLGLVLYLMFNYDKSADKQGQRLRNSLPWTGRHAGEVLNNIYKQPLEFKKDNVPSNIKQIIEKMLKINPSQRMSFKELFSLEQFQQHSAKSLKLSLSESNLAISKSFLSKSQIQDEFCLTQGKLDEECVAEEVEKKSIDWELLKLLEIKDSEHYEDDEVKDAIDFYNMLLTQLKEIKEEENQQHQQLAFLLQKKIYELQSWRLWNITYQQQHPQQEVIRATNKQQPLSTIQQIDHQLISQLLEQIRSHYSMFEPKLNELTSTLNEEKFEKLIEKPSTEQLTSKEKVIINFIKPDAQLLSIMRLYIKHNFDETVMQEFLKTKIKCDMNLTQESVKKRKKIHFLYDLFTAIEFQYSWKIKSQLSGNYGKKYSMGHGNDSFFQTFKNIKNNVNITQIIKRIKEAYSYLKIANTSQKP